MLQNTVRRRKLGKKNYMLHHLYLFHHEDKSNERSYNIMIASHCFPQTSQFSEKKKLFFLCHRAKVRQKVYNYILHPLYLFHHEVGNIC